jgi:hypothetical protein
MNSHIGRGIRAITLVGASTVCLGFVIACGGRGGGGGSNE